MTRNEWYNLPIEEKNKILKEHRGSNSALSDGVKLPDYKQAYTHGSYMLNNDAALWEMQNGARPLDWDTIRDRLADAYMAGVRAAT